jgi:uncharacterized protein HemX
VTVTAPTPKVQHPAPTSPVAQPAPAPAVDTDQAVHSDTELPDVTLVTTAVSDVPDTATIEKMAGGNSVLSAILLILFIGNSLFTRFSNQKRVTQTQELQDQMEEQSEKTTMDHQKLSTRLAENEAQLEALKASVAALEAEVQTVKTPRKTKTTKTTRKPRTTTKKKV